MFFPHAAKALSLGLPVFKSNSGLGYNQYITLLLINNHNTYVILDSDDNSRYPEGSIEDYEEYEIEPFSIFDTL